MRFTQYMEGLEVTDYQEVEVTIKGKVRMPTADKLLEQYGSADVLEAFIEDWNNTETFFLTTENWFLVSVEKVNPASEPSLIEHVKKTL
jgi:hypothetical protein